MLTYRKLNKFFSKFELQKYLKIMTSCQGWLSTICCDRLLWINSTNIRAFAFFRQKKLMALFLFREVKFL